MTSMMSLNALPSAATVYGAYASISSSVMLLNTTFHQIVPKQVQDYVLSVVSNFFKKRVEENSLYTLIVEKFEDDVNYRNNHLFSALEIYMSSKATPITNRLKILKLSQKTNQLTTRLDQQETITDSYRGVEIKWSFFCRKSGDKAAIRDKVYWFELSFEKVHREIVIDSYIPFVLKEVTTIQNAKRDLKLHTYVGRWSSIDLEHSSTFDTLAMEPSEKKALMDDLDLFVKRRDFFKRVGRAWKRGYLLYGPPGTGKSSLVAAMANYLKFDIYDLQLMNVGSDNVLRSLLMGIANRSILVIEDIDCSVDLPDRITQEKTGQSNSCKFSLSGLLNCIDGLWSSCGDERIIIFTTNHKDKLDPALLRPGRMDMHIHMSYLTINGFKTLASTYLEITDHHWRFMEIEELLGSIEVTPAEVAEELMRSSDTDVCLGGVVSFLKEKKRKRTTVESKDRENTTPGVEIPNAKKIRPNDWQHGLYGWYHPMQNGIVAPVNHIRMKDQLDLNVKIYGECDPIDNENNEDYYNSGYTSNGMDDEDNERNDEDNETYDEDSYG